MDPLDYKKIYNSQFGIEQWEHPRYGTFYIYSVDALEAAITAASYFESIETTPRDYYIRDEPLVRDMKLMYKHRLIYEIPEGENVNGMKFSTAVPKTVGLDYLLRKFTIPSNFLTYQPTLQHKWNAYLDLMVAACVLPLNYDWVPAEVIQSDWFGRTSLKCYFEPDAGGFNRVPDIARPFCTWGTSYFRHNFKPDELVFLQDLSNQLGADIRHDSFIEQKTRSSST